MSSEPSEAVERGAVEELAFHMAADDVLTAWRVRNAALAVAAAFVHPGPDHADMTARQALVREWVSEGHEQVTEENHQRTQMLGRMVRAEHEAARLREGLQEIVRLAASGHSCSGGILRATNAALTEGAALGRATLSDTQDTKGAQP